MKLKARARARILAARTILSSLLPTGPTVEVGAPPNLVAAELKSSAAPRATLTLEDTDATFPSHAEMSRLSGFSEVRRPSDQASVSSRPFSVSTA